MLFTCSELESMNNLCWDPTPQFAPVKTTTRSKILCDTKYSDRFSIKSGTFDN